VRFNALAWILWHDIRATQSMIEPTDFDDWENFSGIVQKID
jgi:hypothetical protein